MGELDPPQRERLRRDPPVRRACCWRCSTTCSTCPRSRPASSTLVSDDFDLETVAVGADRELRASWPSSKGLDFDCRRRPTTPRGWWRGDADRLRQILGNLVSNAVKFTPQGAVAAAVDVDRTPARCAWSVRDTGVGIAPEKLPAPVREVRPGRRLHHPPVRRHGPGPGHLPRAGPDDGRRDRRREPRGRGLGLHRRAAAAARPGRPADAVGRRRHRRRREGDLRLLAAEDNPTNQQVLAALLESLGVDIDIVGDGQPGGRGLEGGGYDLILMDIQMPVMDGIDAAREIRAAGSRRAAAAARRSWR